MPLDENDDEALPLETDALLEEIVRALVDKHEDVEIEVVTTSNQSDMYRVHVDPSDCGKVIGRHGKTIGSIRWLMNSIAARERKHVFVEVVEPEKPQIAVGSRE